LSGEARGSGDSAILGLSAGQADSGKKNGTLFDVKLTEDTMPQQGWLPLIPSGVKRINDIWNVAHQDDQWVYFCGLIPVFSHDKNDQRSFRMFTAQLVNQGGCKQAEIVRAFGLSRNSVSRDVKKYRRGGADAFFRPRKGRGGSVITVEVKTEIEVLFAAGKDKGEVAQELGIKYNTLLKAIAQGRVVEPPTVAKDEGEETDEGGGEIEETDQTAATDKSTRSIEDAAALMGNACTRPVERIGAALGLMPMGATTQFEPCRDVSLCGVLCALPALVANGLLSRVDECFQDLAGYYSVTHVLILLADMALCRIKTVEQLQSHPPGEMGKLMGLDRVPEVRCLRGKLAELSENQAPQKWSRLLSKDWMDACPELAGALYVDGHVRVYHGSKTELPKRFVSRERLCLRGTTDYWTNDALGQPFFVVSRPVDQGLIEALRTDIVPRLLQDVPGQPSPAQLKEDPYLARFTIIFDREGYSPLLLKEMWNEYRIACITYHKFPKEPWPEARFIETEVKMPNGEQLTIKLAEMGSFIGDKKNGLWVREVRKLCKDGHQTSLISSAKGSLATRDAALIFSRWSQENFFAYMEKNFAIDLLSEYGTEEFPGTQQVVNPLWRALERERRSVTSKLAVRRANFANLELHPELGDEKKIVRWNRKKAELVEQIENLEHHLETIKQQIKETPKHIEWHDLPSEHQFEQLKPSRKLLMDTVKMVAYRAETAMVNIVREELARKDDSRTLIQDLCRQEADILPNPKAGTLTIRVHSMANARSNRAIEHLLTHLNDAAFNYPGTNLRLVYQLAAPKSASP
jgi:transposase